LELDVLKLAAPWNGRLFLFDFRNTLTSGTRLMLVCEGGYRPETEIVNRFYSLRAAVKR